MQLLNLATRQCYGTYLQLRELDTPDILDIIEHAHLCDAKEQYYQEQKTLEAQQNQNNSRQKW